MLGVHWRNISNSSCTSIMNINILWRLCTDLPSTRPCSVYDITNLPISVSSSKYVFWETILKKSVNWMIKNIFLYRFYNFHTQTKYGRTKKKQKRNLGCPGLRLVAPEARWKMNRISVVCNRKGKRSSEIRQRNENNMKTKLQKIGKVNGSSNGLLCTR